MDDGRAQALCDRIEQDVIGIRRILADPGTAETDPLHQAASAVELAQTLRRDCDDLFRGLLADALDAGVPPRVMNFPGD